MTKLSEEDVRYFGAIGEDVKIPKESAEVKLAVRVAVLEQELADTNSQLKGANILVTGYMEERDALKAENKRLKDALIPVPERMSLSQVEAWLNHYELKRMKALEGTDND